MKISGYINHNYKNMQKQPSFTGVKEAIDIWQESKPTIQQALEALGNKNISLIMHGNSFPSAEGEDFSIGSPYSNGAKEAADFFGGVFSQYILGPWGMTSSGKKHSPYNSTLESRNPFFINYKYLTTKEGGSLLSSKTFDEVVKNRPEKSSEEVNYEYVEKVCARMLDEAYNTYKSRLENGDEYAAQLHGNIEKFREDNSGILLDAIYACLKDEYKTGDFSRWSETDSKLPILIEERNEQAIKRKNEIIAANKDKIDRYIFTQYLAKEHMKLAPVNYVADKEVAISKPDEWKFQDIILYEVSGQSICLGVPGDSFSSKGRCWGIPVIDYTKLFNEDNSLTKGGERLYKIYRNIFRENRGGVRIDHFQGVIDPYVCVNNSAEPNDGAARLLSSPLHSLFDRFSIITPDETDESKSVYDYNRIKGLSKEQIEAYDKFFDGIILAAAKAEGLDETNIMPEDLGSITKPAVEVIKKHQLGSMKVTQFVNPWEEDHMYRGRNSEPKDFISTGTHDTKPMISYMYNMSEEKYQRQLDMLAGDLAIDYPIPRNDRIFGIKLKFAELFASPAKNVQLFFTHLLGMDSWYNKPGDKNIKKWSLRMPPDYKEIYLRNMIKGTAFNPYDALSKALQSKHNPKYDPIINQLQSYESDIEKELET